MSNSKSIKDQCREQNVRERVLAKNIEDGLPNPIDPMLESPCSDESHVRCKYRWSKPCAVPGCGRTHR